MEHPKVHPLRRLLAVPLLIAFSLLWLGIVMLRHIEAKDQLQSQVQASARSAEESVDEAWAYYEANLDSLGAEAEHLLARNISDIPLGQIDYLDGGIAIAIRDAQGTLIRSQLAWGYGHQKGMNVGKRWTFYLDQGLDDAGQIELAQWIVEHREGWEYSIYPPDADGFTQTQPDGTYVRVTGVELPGYAIAVEEIQVIHPDGSVDTVVEMAPSGQETVTMDFTFFKLRSVLLPSWSSSGKDGPVDMERRLANYREAQAIVDRELAGEERSVRTSEGFLMVGSGSADHTARYCGVRYQSAPYLMQTNGPAYLLSLLLTVAAALVLSGYLSKKVRTPAEELCREAETGRCTTDGPVAELNTLAAAFNAAQEQLAGQLDRERDFTRAAAHELKTPLAILRTHAEALREDIAPAKREQYLDIVLDESDRMAQLVSRLLELSRLESGVELNMETVDLAALIREVWAPLKLQLEQKQITLILELEELRIQGDLERLREAVENLASNALRHCEKGGSIRVSLTQTGDAAFLRVYNDGPAIPEEDLPRLFEPFYRGDKSRNRQSGGTGLGLAIVRRIVGAHGGSCAAENLAQGPCFIVSLPVEGTEKDQHESI